MTDSHTFYNNSLKAVFNPTKMIRQIKQSQSRAIAVIEIVDKLIKDGITPINAIRKAFLREQPHQAMHMLHSIRSSISNIGGMRVADIAEDLEDLLDNYKQNKPIVDNLFNSLDREYQLLLTEAETWLQQQKDQLISQGEIESSKQTIQLQQLKQHLENNNLKAWDTFEELQEMLQSSLSQEDFLGLGTFINQFEFDKALKCLQSI